MPMRIGMIAYPLFVIAIAASKGGVVSKFVRAQAVSPETSRKPGSLNVTDLDAVQTAVKRGLLISSTHGRYYVDLQRYRRRQRFTTAAFVSIGGVLAILTIYFLFAPT